MADLNPAQFAGQGQLFPYTHTPAPEELNEFESRAYSQGTPTVRFKGEHLGSVLQHGIRNIHATAPGSSRSTYRKKVEDVLGLQSPVYGYMETPGQPVASVYGDVMARLTPQASARATTSRGDTVNRDANSPRHVAPIGEIPHQIHGHPADVGTDPYVEVQVPTTDNAIPLSDIERMDFSNDHVSTRDALRGRDQARAAGVNARAVRSGGVFEPSFGYLDGQDMREYGYGRKHHRWVEIDG